MPEKDTTSKRENFFKELLNEGTPEPNQQREDFFRSLLNEDQLNKELDQDNSFVTEAKPVVRLDDGYGYGIDMSGQNTLVKQFGEGYFGAQGISDHFDLETDKSKQKFAKDYITAQQVAKVKDINETPLVWGALGRGTYGAAQQNVSLLSGIDPNTEHDPWMMSQEELDGLRNDGHITTEEYTSYLERRNALPFLTSLTAAVGNSLLIAWELPAMGTTKLAGASAKFLSWAGAKFFAKNLVKLGTNSLKLMGPGAVVKTAIESDKEIREMKNPDVWDAMRVTSVNLGQNLSLAAMEGISEGLIPNMPFIKVAAKELKALSKPAWKQFGLNLLKKVGAGFGTEAATEQTTDMLQDVYDGTKSSVLFSQLYGSSEEKKAAWENLLIEGLTGFILGNAFGMSEVFGPQYMDSVIKSVKDKEITEKEGEILLEIGQDPEAAKKFWGHVRESNEQKFVPEHMREAKAGLETFQKFGSRLDPNMPLETDEEVHAEGLAKIKNDLPENVTKVDAELTKMFLEDKVNPNMLDAMLLLGRENFTTYLKSMAEKDNDFNFVRDFQENHPAANMPRDVMNQITERATDKIMQKAIKKSSGVISELGLEEAGLKDEQAPFFDKDVITGISQNMDELGWDIFKKKWEGFVGKEALDNIVKRAQEVGPKQAATLHRIGENALANAFRELSDEVNREYIAKVSQEMDAQKESIKEINQELDEAIGEIPGQDQGPFDQTRYPEEDKVGKEIAETLGLDYEGTATLGSNRISTFSTKDKKTTRTVIVGKGLKVSAVSAAMRDRDSNQPFDQTIYPNPNYIEWGRHNEIPVGAILRSKDQNLWRVFEAEQNENEYDDDNLFLYSVEPITWTGSKYESTIDNPGYDDGRSPHFMMNRHEHPQGTIDDLMSIGIQAIVRTPRTRLSTPKFNQMPSTFALDGHKYSVIRVPANAFQQGKLDTYLRDDKPIPAPIYLEAKQNAYREVINEELNTRGIALQGLYDMASQDFNSYQPYAPELQGNYQEVLKSFEGKTVKDLAAFLKGREIIDPVFTQLLEDLLPHIKDVPIQLTSDLDPQTPGRYLPEGWNGGKETIQINLNATLTSAIDPLKTLLHEAIHAWTVEFMASPEGQAFRGEVQFAINTVQRVLDNPEKAVEDRLWLGTARELHNYMDQYKGSVSFRADVTNYLSRPEEFLAALLSDTTRMREFAQNISAVSLMQPGIKAGGVIKKTFVPTLKIISGGQIGADRAGLEAGIALGLETGGTAPKGFQTSKGSDLTLKRFGVTEVTPEQTAAYTGREKFYGPRTELNVVNSDGTVLFGENMESPGSKLTKNLAKQHNKPYLENPTDVELRQWLIANNIKVLNVAGNRSANVDVIKSTIQKAMQAPVVATTPVGVVSKTESKWARRATNSYEVSTRGDRRFSAFNAVFKEGAYKGKSIEEVYQTVIKGYATKEEGKGKPPKIPMDMREQYVRYRDLWAEWLDENPGLLKELAEKSKGKVLTDMFATTEINQAHALSDMINFSKFNETYTPVNLWDSIWHSLGTAWKNLFGSSKSGNLVESLKNMMDGYHDTLGAFNKKTRGPRQQKEENLRKLRAAGFEVKLSNNQDAIPKEEHRTDEDIEDDDGVEWQYANSITQLAADIEGTDVTVLRNNVKRLPTVYNFFTMMDELDKKSDNAITKRIAKLFKEGGYNDKVEDAEEFEFRFLTGLYTFLRSSKPVSYVTIKTNFKGGLHSFQVERQPFVFTQGDGVTRGSWGKTLVLDSFLQPLGALFGLEVKDVGIAYTSGFEVSRNGIFQSRVSAKQLTAYHLGMGREADLSTEVLANKINVATRRKDISYIYLGNFGGNNTVPLIALAKGKYAATVEKARAYLQSLQVTMPKGDGAILSMAMRLTLEDLWYGKPPVDGKFAENSVFRTGEFGDLNKIWKRGKKFLVSENFIATDQVNLARIVGMDSFTGMQITGGEHKDIMLNTLVIDSNDTGAMNITTGYAKDTKTGKLAPVKHLLPLNSVLINNYGTEKTDGVVYYIINEFDKVYHNVHGTIKDGVIKAVYASRFGEDPLYLKFSMQGVTKDSPIGQLMTSSGVALMVSDSSAKISTRKAVKVSEGTAAIQQGIFQLNLKQFQRIKEELNTSITGGTVKQMLGSSGLTKGNPHLKSDVYHKAISNFIKASSDVAIQDVNKMASPEGLMRALRTIVEFPQSPKERAISRTLKKLMSLTDEQFMATYGGIVNHPSVSKQLRQRLFRPLDEAVQGRVGGMRATLRPDVGFWNAPGNVDPITHPYNVDMLLMSQPSGETVVKHAFPEQGLYALVQEYQELQRKESRMLANGTHDEAGYHIINEKGNEEPTKQKKWIDWAKSEVQRKIKEIKSDDPKRQKALATGDFRKVINNDDYVKGWREDVIFGKLDENGERQGGILDPTSGSLRGNWVVVTEDFAKKKGVKPGDWVLAIVTPTDSPLGVVAVRVAGIAPVYDKSKSTDRMSVVINSEHIQSIVGKDFDVDTISLVPFDPLYWQSEDFVNVWKTIYGLEESYKAWLAEEASTLLGRPVDAEEVFRKEVYPEFMKKFIVKHVGNKDTKSLAGVENFTAQEHFFAIDRAYLVDPNKAIVRRQFHSMLSAIDMKSDVINVNKDKNNWKIAHLLHLIDTNLSVDFPNKTDRLAYNPPSSAELKTNFAKFEWTANLKVAEIDAAMDFFRWSLGDALTIARGKDISEDESIDYHKFRKYVNKMQGILKLYQANEVDKLILLWVQAQADKLSDRLSPEMRNDKALAIAAKAKMVAKILKNMNIGNVTDYPLFQMIQSLPVNNLPMPGISYHDWLIDQAVTTREVLETSAYLGRVFKEFVKGDAKKKLDYLTSPREGVEYDGVTKYAVWMSLLPLELDYQAKRKNQNLSLDAIRNEIISLIQAYDEVETPIDAKSGKSVESAVLVANRKGRQFAYPRLFGALLQMKSATLKQESVIQFIHGKEHYFLGTDRNGQIYIRKGYEGNFKGIEDILKNKELMTLFTEPDGIWNSTANRLALTNGLSLVDNVPGDVRLELAKAHITQRLYVETHKFIKPDVQALWLSFLGQVSADGFIDSKAPNLITAQYEFNPDKPTDFQGNDIALELLATFEPGLYNQWLAALTFTNQHVNNQDKDIGMRGLSLDPNTVPELFNQTRFDETDGPATVKLAYQSIVEDIELNDTSVGIMGFKKVIKEQGYPAALEIVKGMVRNDVYLSALAQSDIFFGELVHDVHSLGTKEFQKKYEHKDPNLITSSITFGLEGGEHINRFFEAQFGVRGWENYENIPKLLEIFHVLKGAQKSKLKADKEMGEIGRKFGVNYLSYKFVGPLKENKIYSSLPPQTVVDQKFGFRNGSEDLTLGEVDLHMKILPSRTFQAHGESSIAIAKSQWLNMVITRFQTEMGALVEDADEVIKLISDENTRKDYIADESVLTEAESAAWVRQQLAYMKSPEKDELWDMKRRVFETVEDMQKKLKITIINQGMEVVGWRDDISGEKYSKADGWTETKFIDTLFAKFPALRKLEVFAALRIREIYDVKAPDMLKRALDYLQGARTILQVGGQVDAQLEIGALIERYQSYLDAIKPMRGNYAPHQYPIEVYKTWWYSQYKQIVKSKLAAQIARERAKLRSNQTVDDAELASIDINTPEGKAIFNAKVEKYLHHEWEIFKVGNPTTYIIPNLMARRAPKDFSHQYIKGSTEMHFNYINNLFTGLRNDLLYADWMTYLHKARRAGERTYLMELTKMWYADQIQNKMLHTKPITTDQLTAGMQINFIGLTDTIDPTEMYPRTAGVQVWGIVDKVDKKKNLLYLKIDRDGLVYKAKLAIANTQSILEKMSVDDQIGPATMKQVTMLRNMLQRGYLSKEDLPVNLEVLSLHQAAQTLIKGHQWVINNSQWVGVYNLDNVYTRDLRGRPNYGTFNRYMRRGAVEKLHGIAREYNNLKGDDGTYDNSMDHALYAAYKGAAYGIGGAATALKTTQAMTFLGMAVAPKAFVYNWMGAKMANLSDAPLTNWRHSQKAKGEWRTIEKKSPSKMNPKERAWFNIMTSLGLGNNKNIVAIALQNANIDPVDVLSQQGKFDAIRYLVKGILEGGDYEKYLKRLEKLRTEFIQTNFSRETHMKIMKEENLWRAWVDGKINKRLYKTHYGIKNFKVTRDIESNVTDKEAATILSSITEKQRLAGKRAFVEEANLTRHQALKQAAKYLRNSVLRGDIGLGMQARAEKQRRPGFAIGYQTAKKLGFNDEQAMILGVNSIEYRHAFYSSAYKQYGANTKVGALMFQFSQYAVNSFEKQFKLFKESIPQTYRHWAAARLQGASLWRAFYDTILKRTTDMTNAMGHEMKNVKGMTMGEVNIAHYILMRWVLGTMLMQAGTRLFYGITNWQDPMIQAMYKIFDLFTDIFKGDVDDNELAELLWVISDVLFFVGVPYKLALQLANKDPNQDWISSQVRGRVDDQLDFVYRVNNEIGILRQDFMTTFFDEPYKPMRKMPQYKKNLEQWQWWFDDFFAGVKFFGYSAPDKSGVPYPRFGFYPHLQDEFPFVGIHEERKIVRPINNLRYINTRWKGINGMQRLFQHGLMEAPLTFIPFLDKAFYPNKKKR